MLSTREYRNRTRTTVMNSTNPTTVPLCVDLDGTLVSSDMLIESVLLLVKQRPLTLLLLPLWLLKGKSYLKHQVAKRANLNKLVLPLNQEVVDYVRSQKCIRKTVLVTGSHQLIADLVGDQLELFDVVKGSTEDVNLTSHRKRDWLVDEFGELGFDYIGNDTDDLNVWPVAKQAMVVSESGGIESNADQTFTKVFETRSTKPTDYLSLLRVHQWAKNVLILVPFVLDQRLGDWPATVSILLAFVAMCLLASVTYIINDMLDLQADRQNTTKVKRALASTRVSLVKGAKVSGLLLCILLLIVLFLPAEFNLVLLSYTVLTLLYSFVFKQFVLLDVCVIASLHTMRVIGGTVAIAAEWSFWLLAFSMFIFFSLALAKRVAELMNLAKVNKAGSLGRDYQVGDIPVLQSIGICAGYLSVLIVALYIQSDKVRVMYSTPEVLWLVCPIIMYWVGRIWIKTARGEMHEDPIIFAMRDRISLHIVVMIASVVVTAKLFG